MSVVNISVSQLVAGMIIADDVYSPSRKKIVTKNTIVNPKVISHLKMFSNCDIPVLIPQAIAERMISENPEIIHANKIKESHEFKKFKNHYSATIETIQTALHNVMDSESKQFDQERLLGYVDDIVSECGNSMHTFDMLHCMRDSMDLTYAHSINVALICHSFAAWLNYSESETRLLTLAGLLHDVGKTRIPNEILEKNSKLTDEEYTLIKKHTLFGYQLVADSPLDNRIKDAVLSHHERCDGSGYPRKLTGDKMSDFAKIVAIADVYDAMTSKRSYRENVCPFDVVAELEADSFYKYDPLFLMTFLKHIVQSYINAPVLLSNSLIGSVVMINQDYPSKPIVKVGDTFLDLTKEKGITIRSLL